MSTQTDHLQEVFGLIDLLYKHIGAGQHAPAVFLAGGQTATTVGGAPVSSTNRMPILGLLRPVGYAQVFTINDTVQTSDAQAIAAGTVALRIQKSSGVSVRFRIVEASAINSPAMTASIGQIMLDDVVGFVDIPLPQGVDPTTLRVQVIRASGNTGAGLFAFTNLRAD